MQRNSVIIESIREYGEGDPVRLTEEQGRLCIEAFNEGGCSSTLVDLEDLMAWMESPGGLNAIKQLGQTTSPRPVQATGVREYLEGDPVRILRQQDRICIEAFNEGGCSSTFVDLEDLTAWRASPAYEQAIEDLQRAHGISP